jgi:AcrR family transcriptional regulator
VAERSPATFELPTASARPERADAVRNRARILDAAERLFAERGVEKVSMDEIAACAGVGKGTLYRRFGDRSGLAQALLDAREVEFQEAFVRGPAPLGPGAPPQERLRAFFCSLLGQLEANLDLLVDSENSAVGARYRMGVYRAYHAHVAMLLRQIDEAIDAELLAHQLLAPLAADFYRHLRVEREMPRERIAEGMCGLLRVVGA